MIWQTKFGWISFALVVVLFFRFCSGNHVGQRAQGAREGPGCSLHDGVGDEAVGGRKGWTRCRRLGQFCRH